MKRYYTGGSFMKNPGLEIGTVAPVFDLVDQAGSQVLGMRY